MFRLGQHELESRVNLILTLFLAATAFQFVVGESLPKVGYLTYMDSYYLMIHNLLLLVLVAEAVLVHYIATSEGISDDNNLFYGYTSNEIDDFMTMLYGGTLVLVNGIFFGVGTNLYNSPEVREAGLQDD